MAIPGYKIIGPDGRETQPFDSDALVSYARQGYIQPQTMVFDPNLGQWLPAAQVPALQSLGGGAPSAPPPYAPAGYAAPGASYPALGYANTAPGAYSGAAQNSRGVPRGLIIGLAVAAVVVIGLIAFAVKQVSSLGGRTQTIDTADGRYGVRVPALWIHWTTRSPKVVEYMEPSSGTGVTLVRITHSTALPGDLDRITNNCSRLVAARLKSPGQIGTTLPVTIAGYDARQVEMNDDGVVGLHFRLTLLATPGGIYQVSDFQKMANVDEERPRMDKILATFHATGQ